MQIIRSVQEMQSRAAQLRTGGKSIGFVPTMGCLHEGHLGLIDIARREADVVVVSIFVNPTQFGPGEDFGNYPRTEDADIALCETRGAEIVFLPDAGSFYPSGFSTYIEEEFCSRGLCGAFRPGHFRGVATVVLMLFNIMRADVAVFGEKDAQQVAVVRKMAADLFLSTRIIAAPIVREEDGLALSSRNRYLSPEQRKTAPELFNALKAAVDSARLYGETARLRLVPVQKIKEAAAEHLANFPDFRVQYIDLVDRRTAQPVAFVEPGAGKTLIAAAVFLGKTRLIDNMPL
ncbi:MAG: pantoate--beta-alanine ligase [Puniceicoccales bacterium]|jgi:pantoate--beta-alanine ligase|nr:pantoate--beta-alanine ligase [Puniceicoccales bacterium]